jgi:hypothetical protein
MPFPARFSDMHLCPMCDEPVPHVDGHILSPVAKTLLMEVPSGYSDQQALLGRPGGRDQLMGSTIALTTVP